MGRSLSRRHGSELQHGTRFHLLLKDDYLRFRQNKRLDELADLLIKYSTDSARKDKHNCLLLLIVFLAPRKHNWQLSLNSCIPSTIGLAKAGQLYCLLRNKKKETYIILLRAVQRLAPSFNPSSVMLDYEFGAMSAFEEVFPQIRVSGCFFHLANSQRKRVKDGLKLAICKDANLDLQVRMVRAMALVPKTHVMDVWGELIAQLDPRLDLMRKWFETYVGRLPLRGANRPLFSHDKWNVFARLMSDQPRTNNSVYLVYWVFLIVSGPT
ncbi:hypothetical protein QR680_009542 [Steinernema hermaphroditum]|uniref:MULE transposase domain-containing protein n=1 Tax=Steinernema hermaphroditum TaxID=289476 RepID=A0AA39IM05_9BILA|nr:hypothetical protein QR680_009542 [Steinernema hermaphroditum]